MKTIHHNQIPHPGGDQPGGHRRRLLRPVRGAARLQRVGLVRRRHALPCCAAPLLLAQEAAAGARGGASHPGPGAGCENPVCLPLPPAHPAPAAALPISAFSPARRSRVQPARGRPAFSNPPSWRTRRRGPRCCRLARRTWTRQRRPGCRRRTARAPATRCGRGKRLCEMGPEEGSTAGIVAGKLPTPSRCMVRSTRVTWSSTEARILWIRRRSAAPRHGGGGFVHHARVQPFLPVSLPHRAPSPCTPTPRRPPQCRNLTSCNVWVWCGDGVRCPAALYRTCWLKSQTLEPEQTPFLRDKARVFASTRKPAELAGCACGRRSGGGGCARCCSEACGSNPPQPAKKPGAGPRVPLDLRRAAQGAAAAGRAGGGRK